MGVTSVLMVMLWVMFMAVSDAGGVEVENDGTRSVRLVFVPWAFRLIRTHAGLDSGKSNEDTGRDSTTSRSGSAGSSQ